MFERYTEGARRSIFFARYEASRFGSPEITSEQLLLGILREDKTVTMKLSAGAVESIRREIEQLSPKRESVSTSVDLPLTMESKRALAYASEEAERLLHKHIDSTHLLLGLLRMEKSLAAKLLRKYGMEYEQLRTIARQGTREGASHRQQPVEPHAVSLKPIIHVLAQLVESAEARFEDLDPDQRLKRKPWTRKEALGHLIDWAIAHQQWLTRALMEPKLMAAGYPDEAAVAVQHYAEFPWVDTVRLWVLLNGLLIHVLLRVPQDKLDVPCRIGISEPVPLAKLIDAYLEYCQDIVGQILAHL